MAQISLKQLEAFVQVAHLRSFRRAAAALNTTQPNISARIAALEAQLGVTVLLRDAGSVRLTPMGEALLRKAKRVTRAVDDFVATAGDDTLFDGRLRLGVTEMIVHSWLGPYLAALKARFPRIDIDLTVDFSASLSGALFARDLDLTLQSGPFNRASTGRVALGQFRFIWVAAPALGLGRAELGLSDLAQHPILTHARGTLPFEQLREHISFFPEVGSRLVSSSNMSACIEMTVNGLGVACLPEVMLRTQIAQGLLEPLAYPWQPDPLHFEARFDAESASHFTAEAARLAAEIAAKGDRENLSSG